MGDGAGYNPYRKANGEFASKDEVGDLNEKLASDLLDAQDAGDEKLVAQIESYAMDKLPESPIGRKILEEKYGSSATTQKPKADHSDLGLRELQKAAKDTADESLQEEIARRGSTAALKNLARNPEATTAALEAAYVRTDDENVRREIAINPNSDTRIMHPSHVAYAAHENAKLARDHRDRSMRQLYRERAEAIAKSNSMDDATIAELKRLNGEERNRSGFYSSRGSDGPLVDLAMANPDNLISEDTAIEYAKGSPRAASIALQSGRIRSERISELPPESARFAGVKDEAMLRRAAELSASGHWDTPERDPWGKEDPTGRTGREIAEKLITNEATPSDALDRFVGNERVDQTVLYTHPNLSIESKHTLETQSPSVQSHLRIKNALHGRDRAELVAELKVSGGSTSNGRGWNQTHIQLDKEKIASYGLTDGDVERIMGGDGHFFRYNGETGVFGGEMDSSG